MTNAIQIDESKIIIENEKDFFNAWQFIKSLKGLVKRLDGEMQQNALNYMTDNNINEISFSDDIKVIKTKKKTNKFETEEIYKQLNFTQEQIDILPANPAFRKTAVLNNDKISHAHYEDVKNVIEIKELNKKFIK